MSAFMQSLLVVAVVLTLLMLFSMTVTFYGFLLNWVSGLTIKKPPLMVDATGTDFHVPTPVQVAARELEELGFQQDVVLEVHLPEHQTIWYYVNSAKDIFIEVIEYEDKATLLFSTWYDDNGVVETGYPIGENFDTPIFCSHFTKKSISDAYHLHQQQMDKFTAKKSRVPMPVSSLNTYIEFKAKYQVTHKPTKFRHGLARGLGLFISTNILIAFTLIALLLIQIPDLQHYLPQSVIVAGGIVAGLAVVSLLFFTAKTRHHTGG